MKPAEFNLPPHVSLYVRAQRVLQRPANNDKGVRVDARGRFAHAVVPRRRENAALVAKLNHTRVGIVPAKKKNEQKMKGKKIVKTKNGIVEHQTKKRNQNQQANTQKKKTNKNT